MARSSKQYQFGKGFQIRLLALMVRGSRFLTKHRSILDASYFEGDLMSQVAGLVLGHFDKYRKPPAMDVLVTLCGEGGKGNEYDDIIEDLFTVGLDEREFVEDKVVAFARNRAMIDSIYRSVDIVEQGGDVAKIEGMVRDALLVGADFEDIGYDYFAQARKRFLRTALDEGRLGMVPTYIGRLDSKRFLKGGVAPGELCLVLGSQGGGKSMLLTNIGATALMNRKAVVHFTIELAEEFVADRYDRRLTGRTEDVIRGDPNWMVEKIARLERFTGGHITIKYFDPLAATAMTIRNHIELMMATGLKKPDIIIVDYADRLKPLRKLAQRYEEHEETYEALRSVGKEFAAPLWTASQANKLALSRATLTMEFVAGALSKMNPVDFGISICRTPAEKKIKKGRLYVMKNRRGEAEVIGEWCLFHWEKALVRAWSVADDLTFGTLEDEERKV